MRDLESENEQLRDALFKSRESIKEYEKFFDELKMSMGARAFVIKQVNDRLVLSVAGKLMETLRPPQLQIAIGDSVLVDEEKGVVTNTAINLESGSIYVVKSCEEHWAEIDVNGSTTRVELAKGVKVDVGDRVRVDNSASVILANYGKADSKYIFNGDTGVTWEDIGGLEAAKDALQEAIELPSAHPEMFKAYGKNISKGVLLYGPTGCGKTMLAKAAATSLAKTFGKQAQSTGFIYVKGPEILEMWLGNTEAAIRGLFAQAKEHYKQYRYPAIIFIDEAEAILSKRGGRQITDTTVPQFLSEMDGLEESGAFVLLASNLPDSIDTAILRDGRIDRKILVSRPERSSAETILKIHLRNKPVSGQMSEICSSAITEIFSDEHVLYDISYTAKDGISMKGNFRLRDLINGAMLAGIAEKASTKAMRRDIDSKKKKPTGISIEDIKEAILNSLAENSDTDHTILLKEFSNKIGGKITDIRKSNNHV